MTITLSGVMFSIGPQSPPVLTVFLTGSSSECEIEHSWIIGILALPVPLVYIAPLVQNWEQYLSAASSL